MKNKTLICHLFGCTPKDGYGDYAKYSGGVTDGIGRIHMFFGIECKRCGNSIRIQTHLPHHVEQEVKKIGAEEFRKNWGNYT